jgi:type II secretory pathway component GspD/PulD (secretin)
VAGNLFKNINKQVSKNELVILLKPTIIRSDENWKDDIRDSKQRIQALDHEDLSGINSWTDSMNGGKNEKK